MRIDHLAYIMDKSEIPDLLKLEDEAGFEKAVVMTDYSPYPKNRELAKTIKGQERFIGSVWINPRMEGCVEEIEEMVNQWGFKDIKFMPTAHYFMPEWEIVHPIAEAAIKLGVPISIHSGTLFADPYSIRELAEAFPDAKIIMEHSGHRHAEPRWGLLQALGTAKKCDNVYLETAGIFIPTRIKQMVETVGADRVIFGSEAPVHIPKIGLDVVKRAGLSEDEEALVLGDNIAKLYGMR